MTLGNVCEKLGAGGTYQIQEKQMYEPTRTLNGLIEMNVPKQGRDAGAQVYCVFVLAWQTERDQANRRTRFIARFPECRDGLRHQQ